MIYFTLRSVNLTIDVSSSGGSLEQTTPAVGKIDQGLQILVQFKNDFICSWQFNFWKILLQWLFSSIYSAMQCISDKSNYAATDEWCANNYKITTLCTGGGCKLVATEIQKNDESLTIGKNYPNDS